MSQHDMVIDNQSGAAFRADLNLALAALVGLSNGSTAPATTFAFMLWADTTSGNLKIRNAANSAWITIGLMASANFGALLLTGGTMTGALILSTTDAVQIPVGTTAQRPTAVQGQMRYNTDLGTFEGYNGTAWASVGGGGYVVTAVATITAGGTILSSTIDRRQMRHIKGSSGGVTASITPFGTSGGWSDGTEMLLVGNDLSDTVILTYNDNAKGIVGNFLTKEVKTYDLVKLIYSASLDRWILQA